jgi:hypothetical protein
VIDQWRTDLRLCDSGLGISESRFFCCIRRARFDVFIKCEEEGLRAMVRRWRSPKVPRKLSTRIL